MSSLDYTETIIVKENIQYEIEFQFHNNSVIYLNN